MFKQGKYGRYIERIFQVGDFAVIVLAYVAVALANPGVTEWHRRLTWVLMAVAAVPGAMWLRPLGQGRAVPMDRVARSALLASLTHFIVFMALLLLLDIVDIPWQVLAEYFISECAAVALWRVGGMRLLKVYRRRGGNLTHVGIVGCRTTGSRLYFEMTHDDGFGYSVSGFWDLYCPPGFEEKDLYRGTVDDLERNLGDGSLHLDELYYTLSGEDGETVRRLVCLCDRHMIHFKFVPQMSPYLTRNLRPGHIGSVPVLAVRNSPLDSPANRVLKRAFDIVFSGLFLLVSPLVFVPVAVAVKLSSPGPVFFKQKRTGYKGKEFCCWKFRTMRVNAQADMQQATRDDPRKTRLGELLRRTSIDELPQFINVFKGDMSVVGPRPHMLRHTEQYSRLLELYMVRHLVKPGITGWAQVRGYRGQTDELWQMQRRIEHDIWYMEHWTFLLDLKIIVGTFMGMFGDDKAY